MSFALLEVFFDGDCPLCRREIAYLNKRVLNDEVLFTDLAGIDFSEDQAGKPRAELMARIHGKRSDGSWVEGVDLFSELYELCRLPVPAAIMRNRLLRPFLIWCYGLFARHRLTLTGRKICDTDCRVNTSP